MVAMTRLWRLIGYGLAIGAVMLVTDDPVQRMLFGFAWASAAVWEAWNQLADWITRKLGLG